MSDSNIYKGISFPFRFNSQGRVERSKLTHDDFTRIKESITQIIFTYKMERIMENDFGMARDVMFTPLDDLTDRGVFRYEILQAISAYEPRVEVIECDIYPSEELGGTLIVDLSLHVVKFVTNISIQIPLEFGEGIGSDF